MTAEIIEIVTPQVASPDTGPVIVRAATVTAGVLIPEPTTASQPDRIRVQTWTAVTEARLIDQPPGKPALFVIEGVTRALHVRIHDADGEVAIVDIDTGVFGVGETLPAAVQDLRDALRDHLAVLEAEDALAPNLQHQLDILRSYFVTP